MAVLRDVARTYGGARPVRALKSCNLVLRRGDYVAIVGPSGSGKSTLLNVLGLLDIPSAGTYLLEGVDVAALRDQERTQLRAQRIGFVFQAFHLLIYRTAAENVELGMIYGRMPRAQRRERTVEVLDRVGLANRVHALPSTLSGGERQRVAIARALVNGPSFVLCDEPTGNLDSVTSDSIMSLLSDLNSDGVTVVVVTHDERVAARAGRVVTIVDGIASETAESRSSKEGS